MSQSIKTFVHPAVARARKEAAQECAQIAAEVSKAGGSAERVRELIVERFELEIALLHKSDAPRNAHKFKAGDRVIVIGRPDSCFQNKIGTIRVVGADQSKYAILFETVLHEWEPSVEWFWEYEIVSAP